MKYKNFYIPKANIVWHIIENYDPEQRKVKFDVFMKKSHKELWKLLHQFTWMFGSPRRGTYQLLRNKKI